MVIRLHLADPQPERRFFDADGDVAVGGAKASANWRSTGSSPAMGTDRRCGLIRG